MRRHATAITKEEKAAAKLGHLVSDFTLDLDAVGFYLARAQPYIVLRRAIEVLESAEYNKERIEREQTHERLF